MLTVAGLIALASMVAVFVVLGPGSKRRDQALSRRDRARPGRSGSGPDEQGDPVPRRHAQAMGGPHHLDEACDRQLCRRAAGFRPDRRQAAAKPDGYRERDQAVLRPEGGEAPDSAAKGAHRRCGRAAQVRQSGRRQRVCDRQGRLVPQRAPDRSFPEQANPRFLPFGRQTG